MPVPDFTASPAAERLLGDLMTPTKAAHLVAALYGPSWQSHGPFSIRRDSERLYATRHPKPTKVSRLLRPVLTARLAHDGRSGKRDGVSAGWWTRTDSGVWEPVSPTLLMDGLDRLGDEILHAALYAEAVAEDEIARAGERLIDPDHRNAAQIEAIRRLAPVAYLVASAESLAGLLSSGMTRLGPVLSGVRDEARLPIREVLLPWLRTVLADREPGSRIRAAELRRAYEAAHPSPENRLPTARLFAGLDEILGPRDFTDETRPTYTVPARVDLESGAWDLALVDGL